MKYGILAIGLLSVSACNPVDYETPTITVSTPSGPVICQIYRHDIVLWDRAVSRPASMTDDEANQACRTEGYRIRNGAPEVTGSDAPAVTETQPL